jgi:hypothetical protein
MCPSLSIISIDEIVIEQDLWHLDICIQHIIHDHCIGGYVSKFMNMNPQILDQPYLNQTYIMIFLWLNIEKKCFLKLNLLFMDEIHLQMFIYDPCWMKFIYHHPHFIQLMKLIHHDLMVEFNHLPLSIYLYYMY